MAPRRPRQVSGQQRLFEPTDEVNNLAEKAAQRVQKMRSKEERRVGTQGRNLRALAASPVKEELPTFLPFDSSRVMEAGYSRDSHTLYVRFRDGTPWQYNNVEPNIWRNFRRSGSPGRFINRVLNNYSYGPSNF